MATRLSRRKITSYIADQLLNGDDNNIAINQLAAYLIDTKRTKELELITHDIEYELHKRGVVVAHVTSAFALTAATQKAINDYIAAETASTKIHLQQFVDPEVLGGVKISIPGKQYNATIAHKLQILKMNVKK